MGADRLSANTTDPWVLSLPEADPQDSRDWLVATLDFLVIALSCERAGDHRAADVNIKHAAATVRAWRDWLNVPLNMPYDATMNFDIRGHLRSAASSVIDADVKSGLPCALQLHWAESHLRAATELLTLHDGEGE